MTIWYTLNTALYRTRYAMQARRARRRGGAMGPVASSAGRSAPRLLHVAWGRIGDAVMGTGILKHFRAAFPDHEIVHLGRAETRTIVAPYVDRFLAFDERGWNASAEARRHFASKVAGEYDVIASDLHLFYGGTFALGDLLEALPARHKFVYAGYDDGVSLAPRRHVPAGFEVVPSRPRRRDDVSDRHLLLDGAYYLGELTRRVRGEAFEPADTRPALELDAAPRPEFEDAIAWQPFSNNRKKDYPPSHWEQVLAAFPTQRFVALGTERDAVDSIGLPNMTNLCGRTSVAEAATVIASARGFLGPDSGLTHIAACLGRPTVCVTQSSNLGYFFPYPQGAGFDNLRTVAHPDFERCSGCFMTCAHEPILVTALRGAKCIRELPPESVVDAIRATIRTEAAAAVSAG